MQHYPYIGFQQCAAQACLPVSRSGLKAYIFPPQKKKRHDKPWPSFSKLNKQQDNKRIMTMQVLSQECSYLQEKSQCKSLKQNNGCYMIILADKEKNLTKFYVHL